MVVYRILWIFFLKYFFYIIDIVYSNYGSVCLLVINKFGVLICLGMEDVKFILLIGFYIDVLFIGY